MDHQEPGLTRQSFMEQILHTNIHMVRTWKLLSHVPYLTNLNNQGMAFEETYELKLNSTCGYHGNYYSMVYWEFNATNPVPNCIRKI